MKRSANKALDASLGSARDSKRPAPDFSLEEHREWSDSIVPASSSSESHVTDSTIVVSDSIRPESAIAAQESAEPAALDPMLPLAPDGDAAAGPRPESDFYEWEFIPSPVRLRRSHRISDLTWLSVESGD